MRIIKLINTQTSDDTYCGQTITGNDGYYIIPTEDSRVDFSSDIKVQTHIEDEKLVVNDGVNDLSIDQGLAWLHGDLVEIKQKNDHELKPLGMVKKKFTASDYCCAITLSNKSGSTFDYNSDCPLDPEVSAYVAQDGNQVWCKVTSVDTVNHTVTFNSDKLSNGSAVLSNKVEIYYELPSTYDEYDLWGLRLKTKNAHEDDFASLEIYDTYNVLGQGAMYEVKDYERTWISAINDGKPVLTPDGMPGVIPQTFTLGMDYHCFDTASTVVSVWIDYIITIHA